MRLIEHFFRTLAPDECVTCGVEGTLLCDACVSVNLVSPPERCYRCFRISPQSKTCRACRHHSVLKHVWIRTEYGQTAKNIVHRLKFDHTKSAARIIAQELATQLPALTANTILVHIPAATSHVRQRGFDQSALIARELSVLIALPHVHALARLGQQRQVGSSRSVRETQMKDACRVVSRPVIDGMNVLLVDDVLTTGSTLESAALALRRAGAASVSAATFAQAI